MRKGKTITELSHELERRQALKKDFVVNTRQLQASGNQYLRLDDDRLNSGITRNGHSQLSAWSGIPKKYYDRLLEVDPNMWAANLNLWFRHKATDQMIRTLDGECRAFLSSRYRRIDNEQVAEGALRTLLNMGNDHMEVLSADVTESKLYIQACFPKLEGEVKKDDPVRGGLIISNSEIGQGQFVIQPIIYRLACMNGMVVPKEVDAPGLTRRHVGRKATEVAEDYSIYRDETLEADDHTLQLKMRDTIHSMADEQRFNEILQQMRMVANSTEATDPQQAVNEVAEAVELPGTYQGGVLESLIRNGDYSLWGMANAVTEQAHQAKNYDDSVQLEEIGGKMMTTNFAKKWSSIVEAA